MSSPVDKFRPTGRNRIVERPRQCVFVGSTNEAEFLTDKTGSRRFWVVEVGDIDIEGLKRDRDQLWAEAVAFYRGGETWYLDRDLERLRERKAEQFKRQDVWDRHVVEFIESRRTEVGTNRFFHVDEVLGHLGKDLDKATKLDQMRICEILKMNGCAKQRVRNRQGKRAMMWSP